MVFLSPNTSEMFIAKFAVPPAGIEIPDAEFGCVKSGVTIGHESYRDCGSATAASESPVRWGIDCERAAPRSACAPCDRHPSGRPSTASG